MMYCPQCCGAMPEPQSSSGERLCPQCTAADDGDSRHWANAARVANLAEAGYLVSKLESEGIEARLVETNSFDALGGAWGNLYLLQVAKNQIDEARLLLHSEAAEADTEEPYWRERGAEDAVEPDPLVVWRPVALMALAGMATLWYGASQWAAQRPPQPVGNITDLAAAMDDVGQPFVVLDAQGNLVHRLTYQSRQQSWKLESDYNGDGKVDRLRRYDARPRRQQGGQEIAAWRN
jgi:hypothetical protein